MNTTLLDRCLNKIDLIDTEYPNTDEKILIHRFFEYVFEPVFDSFQEIRKKEFTWHFVNSTKLNANIGSSKMFDLLKDGSIQIDDVYFRVANDYLDTLDIEGYTFDMAIRSFISFIDSALQDAEKIQGKDNYFTIKGGFNDDYKEELQRFLKL